MPKSAMKKLIFPFLLISLFALSALVSAQNILFPKDQMILDIIPVNENLEYPSSITPSEAKNMVNEDLSEKPLWNIIWDRLLTNEIDLYEWIMSPDYALVDIDRMTTAVKLADCYSRESDASELSKINPWLRSIGFFETWNLDESKFNFTKEIHGFFPMKVAPVGFLDLNTGETAYTGVIHKASCGMVKFNDIQKNNKLIPVKRIAYEFLMIDEDMAKRMERNPDNYMGYESTRYYKLFNPHWREYQAQILVEAIFNQVIRESRPIYELNGDEEINFNKVYGKVFPESLEEIDGQEWSGGNDPEFRSRILR